MFRFRFSYILILALCVLSGTVAVHSASGAMPHVQFTRLQSAVTGTGVVLSEREGKRIERFLSAVFPIRTMRRMEHKSTAPFSRQAVYTVVEQDGTRFVLVGFTAEWTPSVGAGRKLSTNVFAAYRIEGGAPNQVWRSKPWEATYSHLDFKTASVARRAVILFQEGGAPDEFSLASVFTFQNKPEGLVINDLTPSLPWLRAFTHFPFRPLYGSAISLTQTDSHLTLSASDQEYQVGLATTIRPERSWQYVPRRDRFERLPHARIPIGDMTHAER